MTSAGLFFCEREDTGEFLVGHTRAKRALMDQRQNEQLRYWP